jgi:hypothetical protein
VISSSLFFLPSACAFWYFYLVGFVLGNFIALELCLQCIVLVFLKALRLASGHRG